MKNFVTILILIFAFQSVNAQVIQIGSGTNINTITEPSPVNIYYRRQVSQFVYTAAEINAAGGNGPNTLSQLGFYITNQPIYAIPGYTIKIKQTLANLEVATKSLNTILTNVNSSDNTVGALLNDKEVYNKLDKAMGNLNLLLKDLRLHPKRYVHISVFGKKDKEGPIMSDDE